MFAICACTAVSAQKQKPVLQKDIDSLFKKDHLDTALISKKVKLLTQSNNERQWQAAAQYYYQLGATKTVDSLQEARQLRFPNGSLARDNSARKIEEMTSGPAMDTAFNVFMKRFPPKNFAGGEVGDNITYDYVRLHIATVYAESGDDAKAEQYLAGLLESFWKANAYAGVTHVFLQQNKLGLAEKYARMAVDSTFPYAAGKRGNSNASMFAASGFPSLVGTLADILQKENKNKEALGYIRKALPYIKDQDRSVSFAKVQAALLLQDGNNQEAFEIYEKILKSGKYDDVVKANMKKAYLGMHANDENGFDGYWTNTTQALQSALKDSLSRSALKELAPGFVLTDLNGKEVSLSDLKGKVVVLDFWATWCGPCKASFPAMQMAINKYKDNPNVAFLFIHTWENSKDPVSDVKTFLKDKTYTFNILFDVKDKETHENKVVKSYKVDGIPAKFVIDANGYIRYKLKGFDGSNEEAVQELSTMIELAAGKG